MDPAFSPMLLGSVEAVPEGDEWAMEAKIDGWRAICHVEGGPVTGGTFGSVTVYGGRNGKTYSGQVPYIEEALFAALPSDTVIDGELIGNDGWNDVQGVMTRTAAHVPSAAIPALTYVVFDVIRIGGIDARGLPWESRRELLEKIDFGSPHVELNPVFDSDQAAADALIARGFEGVVCKLKSGRYVNSRTKLCVKYKPQESCEAIIRGFQAGKAGGKFDGMVGAFEIELIDGNDAPTGVLTTVKCGVDANHESATNAPETWLGQVIEINHHGIQKSGKPRHPMFHRRRDDRAAQAPKGATKMPTKSARERQVERELGGREKQLDRFATGRSLSTGKGRNFNAMKDEKLLKCVAELRAGAGDAYNRALNASGNPEAERDRAVAVAESRGLPV